MEKALEKGILNRDKLSQMNLKDKVELIFHPGFSTKENITDLSEGCGYGCCQKK